jgi:hypothetical protein
VAQHLRTITQVRLSRIQVVVVAVGHRVVAQVERMLLMVALVHHLLLLLLIVVVVAVEIIQQRMLVAQAVRVK